MLTIQPGSALAHRRQDELGEVEGRIDLHLHHQLEALLGELGDRHEVGDGGVVDEDVDRAEGGGGLLDQPLALVGLGQVGLDERAWPPARLMRSTVSLQRAGQAALARLGGAGARPRRGAFHGQARGDGLADAAAGAGDQRDAAGERKVGHTRCGCEKGRLRRGGDGPAVSWKR